MLFIKFSKTSADISVDYEMKEVIRRAVEVTLLAEGITRDSEVSVTLADNASIRVLNRRFRDVDRHTDVLSFPMYELDELDSCPGTLTLGDVVISLERARAQAEEYGHSFEREVAFLTVHSMLHLLGYDHVNGEEEEKEMRRRQSEILDLLGLSVK